MIENIYYMDRWVTLAVNGLYSSFSDAVFLVLSNKFFFAGVIAIFLLLCGSRKQLRFGKHNYQVNWKIMLTIAFFIAITFATTDVVSHDVIKPTVRRLRPAYDPWIHNLVRTPSGRGGVYTFVSNHAANCFGFAILSALVIKNKFYAMSIVTICLAVCYSRIYLGRHFLTDVLGGAVFGLMVGAMTYSLLRFYVNRFLKSSRVNA